MQRSTRRVLSSLLKQLVATWASCFSLGHCTSDCPFKVVGNTSHLDSGQSFETDIRRGRTLVWQADRSFYVTKQLHH